jgi:hypothetical protein
MGSLLKTQKPPREYEDSLEAVYSVPSGKIFSSLTPEG